MNCELKSNFKKEDDSSFVNKICIIIFVLESNYWVCFAVFFDDKLSSNCVWHISSIQGMILKSSSLWEIIEAVYRRLSS